MPTRAISVVLPAHNEGAMIAPTIQSIASSRSTDVGLEFVVVDDASSDGCSANLIAAVPELLEEPNIDIRLCRLDKNSGVYVSRNHGASLATGDTLVMTDAHVRFSKGWDEVVAENLRPNRILSGVTTQEGSDFCGYGCKLLVPFMGSYWNQEPVSSSDPVQVAPCHASILSRELFEQLGGYDEGMILYGSGEPEFSVRAWLHGADVVLMKDLEVEHHFHPAQQVQDYLSSIRLLSVHNRVRFGLLYLSEQGCFQLLRYYARAFPALFQRVMGMIAASDVWERRALLERQGRRSFEWFVSFFELKNQIGGEVI